MSRPGTVAAPDITPRRPPPLRSTARDDRHRHGRSRYHGGGPQRAAPSSAPARWPQAHLCRHARHAAGRGRDAERRASRRGRQCVGHGRGHRALRHQRLRQCRHGAGRLVPCRPTKPWAMPITRPRLARLVNLNAQVWPFPMSSSRAAGPYADATFTYDATLSLASPAVIRWCSNGSTAPTGSR